MHIFNQAAGFIDYSPFIFFLT